MEVSLFILHMCAHQWATWMWSRGTHIFQKSRSHLKSLGTSWVTWSKFCIEGPQILGATTQNLVPWLPDARDSCSPDIKSELDTLVCEKHAQMYHSFCIFLPKNVNLSHAQNAGHGSYWMHHIQLGYSLIYPCRCGIVSSRNNLLHLTWNGL
jgi:hypothetical protein